MAGNAVGRYHRAVKLPSRTALATAFRELGPLRPVALYVAVVPTIGAVALLAALSTWSPSGAVAPWQLATALPLVAAAMALVLVPPMAAALACGCAFGAVDGGLVALLGIAAGAVLARGVVWPRLGPDVFAFMRNRPRAHAVRRLCGERPWWGVLRLRAAAPFPFAVQNLLFAAADVPWRAVFAGSLLGVPLPTFAVACAGAALREWRQHSIVPTPAQWFWFAGVLALAAVAMRAGRRAWRRAGGAGA